MFHTETALHPLTPVKERQLRAFLSAEGLEYDEHLDFTVFIYDTEGTLAATGSLAGHVLKCIAVEERFRGENLTAVVMTALKSRAFEMGEKRLMLFTKPANDLMFGAFGFYELARTPDMLLMESQKDGIQQFLASLAKGNGVQGAVVANCNPFTNGHRYLMEQAASACDTLHVFILSEDKSMFSTEARMSLAQAGVRDIKNIIVHETSDYLVSSATFPTYFLKAQQKSLNATGALDLTIFGKLIAPALNITKRFVGQEPYCQVTAAYNAMMHELLPRFGIEVVEIARLAKGGAAISASRVRELLSSGRIAEACALVPATTGDFIRQNFGIDNE